MDKCNVCGRPESEHHMFVAMPDGCTCNASAWNIGVPPVCDNWAPGERVAKHCFFCQHDEACHKKKEERANGKA